MILGSLFSHFKLLQALMHLSQLWESWEHGFLIKNLLIRKALVEMVIIDELLFIFVEVQGFKRFIVVAYPRFKIPSRWTISRGIYAIYEEKKLQLKCFFRESTQRVSITINS